MKPRPDDQAVRGTGRRAPPSYGGDLAPSARISTYGAAPLRIGLLNNMPDAAFAATERQFRRLLEAPEGPRVDLRLFAFKGRARGHRAQAEAGTSYVCTRALYRSGLDALIITGCEPRAERLDAEPWFREFAEVVDWSAQATVSTLFSCLAAHAAVLHLDGIVRRPLPSKCWGVFTCETTARHALLNGAPACVEVPHSRWNDLAESDLQAAGYRVLRRAKIGVDLFVREHGSLFVFLQGHPEYDGDTLGREHRRDMARFLDGSRAACPPLPERYFSEEAAFARSEFADLARAGADPALLDRFPVQDRAPPLAAMWQREARRLLQNWLGEIMLRRTKLRQITAA